MTQKICRRCIYDENISAIRFDENGVCNYCKMIDDLREEYKTGTPEGEMRLEEIIEQIRKEGREKPYDCVVGVSGGTDSSFMVYKAVRWGLRPLAVHYDNTWNTAIATENIRKILRKLKVDLYTYVVDNKEMDDIFRAFFRSGIATLDVATDIALSEVLYRAASKYRVKYILEGHSFEAEGVSPLGRSYADGRLIYSVHKRFGTCKMKTFPNMTFFAFMKWILIKRIKKIRPYWYIHYSKQEAQKILEKEFDWKYYGGHHLENRMTAFGHSYYKPTKFGIDERANSLSAAVRNGVKTREEALAEYAKAPHIEEDLIPYFKKRLEISDNDFDDIMNGPKRNYRNFKTYKHRFERMRPFFYVLAKANLVPMSFYIKYTSKNEI